jgi:hypothetical protein
MVNLIVVLALLVYAHWRFGSVTPRIVDKYSDL